MLCCLVCDLWPMTWWSRASFALKIYLLRDRAVEKLCRLLNFISSRRRRCCITWHARAVIFDSRFVQSFLDLSCCMFKTIDRRRSIWKTRWLLYKRIYVLLPNNVYSASVCCCPLQVRRAHLFHCPPQYLDLIKHMNLETILAHDEVTIARLKKQRFAHR